jgi:glycosyltransferase involved in cell wall biosynthesis
MRHRVSAALLTKLPVSLARKAVHGGADTVQNRSEGLQLLVDISEVIQHDARTGIQRVVRGILQQLLAEPPDGYQVKPVFAERKDGYRYAPVSLACLQADVQARHAAMPVVVAEGDIFLGLDLAAHFVPHHQKQLLKWKRRGVRVCFVVYDLLPLLHPHWFKPARYKTFKRWLKTLAIYADDLVCISETVKSDLANWLRIQYGLTDQTVRLHAIPLGADLKTTMPSSGCTADEQTMLEQLQQRKFVLMVGTLEPRKGYADALAAFERFWADGEQTALVIVGKPGWKTENLQNELRTHSELTRRLYWFESASDELLEQLYKASFGILLASEAEGFGLPLVEAQHYGKPVLARDLAVYKELENSGVTFFNQPDLTKTLAMWLSKSTKPVNRHCITWCKSAQKVSQILLQVQPNVPK